MGVFASLKYIKLNVGLYTSMQNWYSIGTVKTTKKKTEQHIYTKKQPVKFDSNVAGCLHS